MNVVNFPSEPMNDDTPVEAGRCGLDDLQKAAQLMEQAAFNMAKSIPSEVIAQLLLISANLEQLTGKVQALQAQNAKT